MSSMSWTRSVKDQVDFNKGTDPEVQEFSLLLQAAPPSAGGCAAASAGGRGLSAPMPHGPLRDPLGLGTDE
jgi:hypothetical protein